MKLTMTTLSILFVSFFYSLDARGDIQDVGPSEYDLLREIHILEIERDIEYINEELAEKTQLLTFLFNDRRDLEDKLVSCGCSIETKMELGASLKVINSAIAAIQEEIDFLQDELIDIQESMGPSTK